MQARKQIEKYKTALNSLKVMKVRALRKPFSSQSSVITFAAIKDCDHSSYFQILLMSELCEKLLILLQHATFQTFFRNQNLELNRANSMQYIIKILAMHQFDIYRNDDKRSPAVSKFDPTKYIVLSLFFMLFVHSLIYLLAAIVALKFTIYTLILAFLTGFSGFLVIVALSSLKKSARNIEQVVSPQEIEAALNFIKRIHQEEDHVRSYAAKSFVYDFKNSIPCTQSMHQLSQGFFEISSSTQLSTADEVFVQYQAQCKI